MTVKFDQYWTIIPRRNKEYGKFIIKDFIPGMNRLGIHTVAGCSVLVGEYAEIIFEGVSNDLDLLEKALKDPKYRELHVNLLYNVKDYKTKVLVPTGRKDAYTRDVKENTIKFNQAWDIRMDRKEEYERFVTGEFYPIMEGLGITVAGEWGVFIGEGPHIICEGRTQNTDQLIGNLQGKKFRDARIELRKFVEKYRSRFLSFHIQKIKGYKAESYELFP